MITVHHGDCREVIPALGVTVDAVVTDPPYGLEFMGKEWDAPWKYGMRPYGMSDSKGRAPGPSFSSSRNPICKKCRKHQRGNQTRRCLCVVPEFDETEHRLRDLAAFQDWCEGWAREVYRALRPGGFLVAFGGTRTHHRMTCAIEDAGFVIQDCLMWLYGTGFPKNKAQLKPAYEPIILAYKPGGKRTMQVDDCRIGGEPSPSAAMRARGVAPSSCRPGEYGDGHAIQNRIRPERWLEPNPGEQPGRWPANICHDGSDEVVGLFPASESGPPREISGTRERQSDFRLTDGNGGYSDAGSAARFFFSAKAGTQDRWGSKHPTVKPVDLISWLVALVTPSDGTFLDPFAGSGTAAVAALKTGRNAILIEREAEYIRDIKERIAFYQGGGQHSIQAKHRHRAIDHGPLFATPLLTPEEDAADSLASYNEAVMAIGERVKAGAPVPEFMLSRRRPIQS